MHHAVFTIIDANHHTEDWTFMMKDKPMHAHFDLQRNKSPQKPSCSRQELSGKPDGP